MDTTRIAALTEEKDKQEHPILGTCYRVRILSLATVGKRGVHREEKLVAKTAPQKKQRIADEGGNAVGSNKSSESSSDSSSDSSSSSSDKKKKKSKKSKKGKKADKKKKNKKSGKAKKKEAAKAKKAALEEKANAKVAAMEAKTFARKIMLQNKMAAQIVDKLEGPMKLAKSAVDGRHFDKIPDLISGWVADTMRKWAKWADSAAVAVDSDHIVSLPEMKD